MLGVRGFEATPRIWMCERVGKETNFVNESKVTFKHQTKAHHQLEMSRTSPEWIEVSEGPGFRGLDATPRIWMSERVGRETQLCH